MLPQKTPTPPNPIITIPMNWNTPASPAMLFLTRPFAKRDPYRWEPYGAMPVGNTNGAKTTAPKLKRVGSSRGTP